MINKTLSKRVTVTIKKNTSVLTLLLLFLYLFPTSLFASEPEENNQEIYKQLEIFSSVLATLENNYVKEIDTSAAIDGAIRGLITTLDPHSGYLTPEEFNDFKQETFGSFSGIGIEVTTKDNGLTVIAPIDNTPGDRAGIKAQDQIIEIDGEKTSDLGAHKAIKKLRGPQGSKVKITIKRKNVDKLIHLEITRAYIPTKSVNFVNLGDGLVYTRITNFQGNTSHDYSNKLEEQKNKQQIKGLILDLRNNPGGLLGQAISISDLFLKKGEIVSTKGREEEQNQSFLAHDVGEKNDFPVVVLINGGSASASEIVAGALQAHGRAMILGTQSFGKGSVQNIIPLPNGAGLRMTTAHYYTPNGISIQAVGITPDIEVQLTNEDSTKNRDKSITEADLSNHLENPNTNSVATTIKKGDQSEFLLKHDNQLKTAFDLLRGINLYKTSSAQE